MEGRHEEKKEKTILQYLEKGVLIKEAEWGWKVSDPFYQRMNVMLGNHHARSRLEQDQPTDLYNDITHYLYNAFW